MCTVRSKEKAVRDGNIRHELGFVADRKRLNGEQVCNFPLRFFADECALVAITRAKALLIVVGNPEVLCADPYWHAFILYIKTYGGLRGQTVGRVWNEDVGISGQPGHYGDVMERIRAKIFDSSRNFEV
jgi:helicase MOV-10